MLVREFRIIAAALLYFTRLPCAGWVRNPQQYLKDAARYFPLVGWLVGGLAGLVVLGARRLWPADIAALLSLAASMLITGGLHEDGFMDVCDGFGGGGTKDRILEIMKDSRSGAFGVIGIGVLLMTKLAALRALPAFMLPVALWAGHSISRFASITLLATQDYVRPDAGSKAGAVVRRMTRRDVLGAAFWGLTPLVGVAVRMTPDAGHAGGLILALTGLGGVWLARWGMGRWFFRTIGGYTGDCLGAVQQVTEVVFYLVAAAFF